MRTLLAILPLLALGCVATEPPDTERAERFVGFWFVEETEPHALYSASTYELSAGGELALAWDAELYGQPHGYVRSADGALRCDFSDTWRSTGDDTLVIEAACSDDRARDIVLYFANPPATNAAGADVTIVSVGGENGWQPPQWGWSFSWCPELCAPDLR
jgi:hypothetical protein